MPSAKFETSNPAGTIHVPDGGFGVGGTVVVVSGGVAVADSPHAEIRSTHVKSALLKIRSVFMAVARVINLRAGVS